MSIGKLVRGLLAVSVGLALTVARAQDKTEITFARFFGSCEADYGNVNDVTKARGECGIITALINQFNATNTDGIVVKPQIIEWGPYYDQLSARIVSGDVPVVAVMHESSLGDFVKRVEPLDDGLKGVGITPDQFTAQARRGVVLGGKTYAVPWDTWSWLWHINLNLFKKAGLTSADGSPVLPKTPDELLAQARKFKAATGKPYFSWPTVNETAAYYRTFLTLVAQQGGNVFSPDGKKVNAHTKEAEAALKLISALYSEGDVVTGCDYGCANQAFLNGEAGMVVVGTWTIDDFIAASEKAGSPLAGGYTVIPFAPVFGKKAVFADGHSWVLVKGGAKNDKQRQAAFKLLKFMWAHDFEWARTGHLPASKAAAESASFQKLPFRQNIVEITRTGFSPPSGLARQRSVEGMIGEEIANMCLSKKPIAEVQKSMEDRVNKLLASVK